MAVAAVQVPDAEKRRRADFVIDTSTSLQQTQAVVQDLIQRLTRNREAADREAGHGKL